MQDLILALKFSFSYFSIFPISFKKDDDLSKKTILGGMISFFPLVGFILSLTIVTLYTLIFSRFEIYGAILCAIFYMVMYGFIHTEAIIDVVDAIYAKLGGKDSYKVVKEPTIGAMGVLYSFSFVLLKVNFLVYLLLNGFLKEFIAITILSRLSILIIIDTFDFKSTFLMSLKSGLRWYHMAFALIFYISIGSIITPYFILLFIFGLILAFFVAVVISRLIGFINGDVLGATLELVELILLFTILAISYR
jgi:adenosylcobinamide-GDP ribazoletransferase